MFGFILGTKNEQTQMFDTEGKRIPVTLVDTSSCYVIDVRTLRPGVCAIIVGFGVAKKANKPTEGKLKKAGIETPLRFFREFTFHSPDVSIIEEEGKKGIQMKEVKLMIGDKVTPTMFFKEGDIIDVAGTSKGKGFQGVVKRHNFRGGPRTHGQSDRERAPGSVGSGTTPGRIYKGKSMAGRMGTDRVTVKSLTVVSVNDDQMTVKGLVPGNVNGLLEITSRSI